MIASRFIRTRAALFCAVAGAAACHPQPAPEAPPAKESAPSRVPPPGHAESASIISLFITANMQNTTEPCGCTSDPLGDVARIAALVRKAAGNGLLLDAGGLRYKPLRLPAEKQGEARLKADFLEQTWHELDAVTMLQPNDLLGSGGIAELAGSGRLVSNLPPEALPEARLKSEVLRTVNGTVIGILGIADPQGEWPPAIAAKIGEPVPAARQAVLRLRSQGAQSVIALTGLRREAARRLARQVDGLDLVVAGGDPTIIDGVEQIETVGSAFLVVPAIEGQRLIEVELHLPSSSASSSGSLSPVWTLHPTAQQKQQAIAEQKQRLTVVQARLQSLQKDPQAEPTFVATTAAELKRLVAELAQLQSSAPASDNGNGYATIELIPVSRRLPRDPLVAQAMSDLDRRIGEANLKAVTGPPPPPFAGQPGYVGLAGCLGSCHFHDDAVDFWRKTRHAEAFPTLVHVGKELSYDCVRCHAAGFDEPGGSNLWSLAQAKSETPKSGPALGPAPDLRGVQCEVCHGPGSLHVKAPSKNPVPIKSPTQERCLSCHTKEHSDTFDFVPYLRDIVGPGHGADKRAALGNGPTGHELRHAALKKHAAAAE